MGDRKRRLIPLRDRTGLDARLAVRHRRHRLAPSAIRSWIRSTSSRPRSVRPCLHDSLPLGESGARIVYTYVACFGAVIENAFVAREKCRLEMPGRGNQHPVQRIRESRTGNTGRVDGHSRGQVGETYSCSVQGIADPLLGRACQPDSAESMKRSELKQRDDRDANGLLRLCPRKQMTRPAADSARIPLHAPKPDMGVEQQHGLVVVNVVLAINRVEGPLVLQKGSLHRSK